MLLRTDDDGAFPSLESWHHDVLGELIGPGGIESPWRDLTLRARNSQLMLQMQALLVELQPGPALLDPRERGHVRASCSFGT